MLEAKSLKSRCWPGREGSWGGHFLASFSFKWLLFLDLWQYNSSFCLCLPRPSSLNLCVQLCLFLSLITSSIQDDLISRPLVMSAKTEFPTKVTFWVSGWTWTFWGDTIQPTIGAEFWALWTSGSRPILPLVPLSRCPWSLHLQKALSQSLTPECEWRRFREQTLTEIKLARLGCRC